MRGTFNKVPGGLKIIEMARTPCSIVEVLSHVASLIGIVALEGLFGKESFFLSRVDHGLAKGTRVHAAKALN